MIDYLPPILREISEFQAINNANEPEIKAAWDALARVMANQFIDSADELGVTKWEKQLKLFPKGTDTMDARKARIKAIWNRELPYTITWLRNWLAGICGPDGHDESIDGYIIDVRLDYNALPQANDLAREILEMLGNVSPQNMLFRLTASLQSSGYIAHGAAAEMSQDFEIWPRIVNDIESEAKVQFSCFSEINRTIESWPHIISSIESKAKAGISCVSEFNRTVEILPINYKQEAK